jgi:hypothetical protein
MALRLSGLLLMLAALLAGCGISPVEEGDGGQPEDEEIVDLDTTSTTGGGSSLPATADIPDPSAISGRWAADPAWCTNQSLGSPIVISDTRLEGNEDRCEIAGLIDSGDGSFTASLSCEGDDRTETDLVRLTPAGEQLDLTYLGRDDPASMLTRCD